MKVVVLCGGKGTRLGEYTQKIPKPLIEVGSRPILWHIVQMYKSHGFNEFVFCLGYKGEMIREYFSKEKSAKIDFVDTGVDSNKTQRILKAKGFVNGEDFFVTYGDDLSDVDIAKLYKFHKKTKSIVTLTAVRLESPFGIIETKKDGKVTAFREKPKLDQIMNGGFYVFSEEIFNHLDPKKDLEKENFSKLAESGKISAFFHDGFWKSMNTLKDVIELNEMHEKGQKPWLK
jgi:glucose-1-phosphate cytidylyltransferase